MKKEDCEYIRKSLIEHVAPANHGKVSFSDICRVFSDFGSLKELEECVDGLVKSKLVEKRDTELGKMYVFPIAREFGKRSMERIETLQTDSDQLKNEMDTIKSTLMSLEELRSIWSNGWEKVLSEAKDSASVKHYISSVFIQNYVIDLQKKVNEKQEVLRGVETEVSQLKRKLDASYED